MQLKPPTTTTAPLRLQLGLAALALLGPQSGHAEAPLYTNKPAELDMAVLHYQEQAGRVQSNEAVVRLRQELRNEGSLGLSLTIDSLTGGSPNGALPSKSAQTFTKTSGTTAGSSTGTASAGSSRVQAQAYTAASGGGTTLPGSGGTTTTTSSTPRVTSYTVAPGALPLDPNFKDQRLALGATLMQRVGDSSSLTLGGDWSHESDYQSISGSATLATDFDRRNTTLSLGLSLESDRIKPQGGAPVAFSDYASTSKLGDRSKQVSGLLLGVSQIMTRRWVTQLNLTGERSTGYHSDPYKVLSALDASGNTLGWLYESRPNERQRQSVYWGNKLALDQDRIEWSWRYQRDDWGVRSHTLDARYRWNVSERAYLEPGARYYRQTAADFYRLYLLQNDPLLSHASSDPRLASFDARTLSLKFGWRYSREDELSLRVEGYEQRGRDLPSTTLTALQGLDLYPGMRAWVLQLGLKTLF